MNNQPWECPRCHKINAPWNPSCFCKATDNPWPNYSLVGNPKWTSEPIPCTADVKQCFICKGYHANGVSCQFLKVTSGTLCNHEWDGDLGNIHSGHIGVCKHCGQECFATSTMTFNDSYCGNSAINTYFTVSKTNDPDKW